MLYAMDRLPRLGDKVMMMLNFRRDLTSLAIATLLLGATGLSAAAQNRTCKPAELDALIDGTGEYLRTFASKRRPVLHDKFAQLARLKNWPQETAVDRGYAFATSDKTRQFDNRARQLLIELDEVSDNPTDIDVCRKLTRLKAVTKELRTVTEAKFQYMVARIDAALQPSQSARITKADREPPPSPARQPDAPKPLPPWQTTTQSTMPAVVMKALPPPQPLPVETTYTAKEIAEAGRGFFGTISAGLAGVLQYTFKNYGRPNGYILGTEGGAAFLAGISFGKGRLTTKTHAPLQVFWQSPSVGYDLGLQGSRVMILVYNLSFPEKIYKRYAGIGGSAYVVGGAGLTYHKRGKIVLAPIRTGIGLRLGANIGYMKFTPKLTINPF